MVSPSVQAGGGHAIRVQPHVPFEHVQVLQSIILVSPSTHSGGGGGGQALLVHIHWPPLHEQLLQPSKFVSPSLQTGGGGGGQPMRVHCHVPSALHVQVLQSPEGCLAPGVHGNEPPAS
jgi:hypothetical protein